MQSRLLTAASLTLTLAACATASTINNASLPEPIRVPAGHMIKAEAVGVGELTYECREKADKTAYEWVFTGPVATLYGRDKRVMGKYYGGPTWEAGDGSKITGKQLAISPNTGTPGSIPLQLVKTEPAMGMGAMNGVTYIQRLNTQGGVAPAMACGMANRGAQQKVAYQADYIFYAQ